MYKFKIFLVLLFVVLSYITLTAQSFPGGRLQLQKKPITVTKHAFERSPVQIFSDSAHTAWVSVYNDPINGDDEAQAMVQDSYGNLYITGNCSDSGATYGWDITTIKYNSDGVQQWLLSFDGPGHGDDVPYAISVDQHSNVYIAGYSDENGEYNYDFLTLKIDSSGTIGWFKLFSNGAGPKNDVAFSVAVDDSGNVFSTGATFVLASGGFDLTTIKYNPDGVQQWVQRYNSPFGFEDTGNDLVLDSNDNIYITGVSQEEPGNYDAITLKYNNGGNMQWVQRYNGPANSNDGGIRLSLDENSNIIITGYQTGSGTLFDMLTIKYDNDGNQQWASVYNGQENSEDASNDLVLDPMGNIYITGFVTGANSTSDYATLKYNSEGLLQWVSFYVGPANGFEQAYGIALDHTDGVYVTGYSPSVIDPFVHYEYATVKYDTSGQEEWVSRYSGNSSLIYQPNVATAIAVDNSGNVYVTGEIADDNVGEDFGTIKYTQVSTPVELSSFTANVNRNNVSLNWSTATETNNKGFEVDRCRNSEVRGQKVEVSNWNKIGFVAGFGTTAESRSYSFIDNDVSSGSYSYRLKQVDFDGSFKYSNTVEVEVNTPLQFALSQNYPNPFNPSTKIKFSIPKDGLISLEVFNTLGQKITELINGFMKAGTREVTFDASRLAGGVYFYRLESDDNVAVKKLIFLK